MDEKELAGKTVAELKDMAKDLGIDHISGMKKADLVAAISAKGAADSPGTSKEPPARPAAAKAPSAERPSKGGKKDPASLKQEKKSIKAQIAEAVAAGDRARTHELRRRKAEIRRALNRARPAAPATPAPSTAKPQ